MSTVTGDKMRILYLNYNHVIFNVSLNNNILRVEL